MKENPSASAASPPEADAARRAATPASALELILRPFRRSEGGLILAILVVILLTTLLDTQHTYWVDPGPSAWNILRHAAMLGIFALGAAIVIISGGIDLSCGSVIAFSGSFCASLMVVLAHQEAQSLGIGIIVVAIAGTLVMGLLIGSFHAWLITVLGLPPFVATLATLVGLRSLARVMVENVTQQVLGHRTTQIQIFDKQFRYLATSVWIPVVLFVVLASLAWLLMSRTVVGRHLHALGGNEQATRLSGIQTDRLKWLAYCIGAVLSSVAGILYIGATSVAEPQTLGVGYELNAIAAAVVGGCSLQGGVGTIPGTVLGVFFLRIVMDAVAKVIKTNADIYEGLIVGCVVVVAVAFSQLRQARGMRKRFFAGPLGIVTIINMSLFAGALGALAGQNAAINMSLFAGALGAPAGQNAALGEITIGGLTALTVFILLWLARFWESKRSIVSP
jgi:ribose/xylose/arabinose/galactoside ABC-type transport system permease subunit